jgi:phosphoheptose isomerase
MEREAKPERIKAPEQDQTVRFKSLLTARFERSMAVSESFFKTESSRVAQACREMAQRFHRGGRLLSFGAGAAASDAQHVAVEFVHPVTVGRRALPGLALGEETSLIPLKADQNGAGSALLEIIFQSIAWQV